ncbi:MAG: hypothetical protein JXQ90_22965 [Cyclobacteriaceae bacterium]
MKVVDAHLITNLVFIGSAFLVPVLAFGTYKASGASNKKALLISAGITLWGILMYFFCTSWQFNIESPITVWSIVILNVIWPSLVIVIFKDYFVGDGLDLKWLTLIQATRFMGALFILENFLGNTGTAFAYIGGLGDFMAAVIALTILLQLLTGGKPNKFIYYFLIAFGSLDFIVVYGLSLFSSETSLQALAINESHHMNLYPLAMLPYFLVPFAMAYHVLMYMTLKRTED